MFASSRRRSGARALARTGLLLLLLWAGTGCAFAMRDQIHFRLADDLPPACTVPTASKAPMLGVALSGGGSRAAVFGAATLEALWEHGLVDAITHVSAVSGGSLAASYFVLHRPDCPSDDTVCWRGFFDSFQEKMRTSLMARTLFRNSVPWRFGSPTRRVTSLSEVLDSHFYEEATFGMLPDRAGQGPYLIVNAASYDTGRRFAFSNLCIPDDPKPRDEKGTDALDRRILRAQSFSGEGCARRMPASFPLSIAVATSAGFPVAFGPATYEVADECGETREPAWWHLGDGGIIENSGAVILGEIAVEAARNERIPAAWLLQVDSGLRTEQALERERDLSLWSSAENLRFADLPMMRAEALYDVWWQRVAGELRELERPVERMAIRYTHADLDRWPKSCRRRPLESRARSQARIRKRLSEISTALSIGDCDADLLRLAAHQLVHQRLDAASLEQLHGLGLAGARPVRPTHDCSLAQDG